MKTNLTNVKELSPEVSESPENREFELVLEYSFLNYVLVTNNLNIWSNGGIMKLSIVNTLKSCFVTAY